MFAIINEINMKTLLQFFIILFALSLQNTAFSQDIYIRDKPIPCLNKKFSIIVHIVRDSFGLPGIPEMMVEENIETLNKDFEPMCVSFEVCEFRYIDNFQYDTLELARNEWAELQTIYHQENRINLFLVTTIDTDNPSVICGFANLEGITKTQDGGIVMLKSCIGADFRSLSHEMGHYFGLLHTFEGQGVELVDGSNCTVVGDLICDTPADPYMPGQNLENFINIDVDGDGKLECRFINGARDANGEYYRPDVGNIMSYYPDECKCGFTKDQFAKMAEVCLSAPDKMW